MSMLPAQVRTEYEQACRLAPRVVAQETPWMDFLRTDDDLFLDRAAQRLALYWKYRKLYFSESHWTRPLTQTGGGALSPLPDIAVLQTGFTVLLPLPMGGGSVVLVNWKRWPSHMVSSHNHAAAAVIQARIIYYLVTVTTESSLQSQGVQIIHFITPSQTSVIQACTDGWHRLCKEALPCRIKQVLLVHDQDDGQAIDSFATWNQILSIEAGFRCTYEEVHSIVNNSHQSIMEQLAYFGIPRHLVPSCYGGSYEYSSFAEWTLLRLRAECFPILTTQIQRLQADGRTRNKKRPPTDIAIITNQHEPDSQSQTGQLIRTGRSRTSIRGRSVYQPQQFGVMTLPEQRMKLDKNNELLRQENRRLESFLAQARLVVAIHNQEQETQLESSIHDEKAGASPST